MDLKVEIEKIIAEGVKNGWEEKVIVDKILSLGVEARKKEHIPIEKYEQLLKDGKRKIQEARKLLVKGLTNS